MTATFNAGLLLCDQAPEIYNLLSGYTAQDRSLELLRLGSAVPANCSGYVAQIEKWSRAVRLDAMRQLQRAGVQFGDELPAE